MKGIIIYKGKYGATQQYAEWLSEKFKFPALPSGDVMKEQVENYDFFILGSSVYIGKLQLANWMKENLEILNGKKIFFFLVSATPPTEKKKLNQYIETGIPPELKNEIEIFFLRGKLEMKKLSWKDRFLLRMGAWLTKDPIAKKKMVTDFNEVKRQSLGPFIEMIEKFISADRSTKSQSRIPDLSVHF